MISALFFSCIGLTSYRGILKILLLLSALTQPLKSFPGQNDHLQVSIRKGCIQSSVETCILSSKL